MKNPSWKWHFLVFSVFIATITAACQNQISLTIDNTQEFADSIQHMLSTNQFEAARDRLNLALLIEYDNPRLYVLRGQANLALYEWELALQDYNKAIDLQPSYAPAYFYRGVLYYSILQTGLETRELALTDFEHYLSITNNGEYVDLATSYIATIRSAEDALKNGG